MKKIFVFIFLICLNDAVQAMWEKEISCPLECICRLEHLTEMAIYRYMQPEKQYHHTSEANILENNDVLYEDDHLHPEHNIVLRTAICMLQTETTPENLLTKIPKNTESLTIIQGYKSGNKTFKFSYLLDFPNLVLLELRGTKLGEDNSSNLLCDIDKEIKNLKFLNLENAQIIIKEKENLNKTENAKKEESVIVEIVQKLENNSHPLTLLKESDTNEILPYNKYIELQRAEKIPLFLNFENLNLLIIKKCALNEIQWEMFEGLHSLKYLILENNELKYIPDFAFYGTPNIKLLSLAHNSLLNIQITDLAGLLELEYLDLSYNNFSQLSELSLPPFPKLKLANFGNNPINIIFPHTFEIMNTTDSLVVGGEYKPLFLMPYSFNGLNLLKKLVLRNVKIPILKRELLIGMPNLDELAITGDINELQFDAFLEVFNLKTLILKQCNIYNVSMDAFIGLKKLQVLDLSKNYITYIPPGTFDDLASLTELYLNGNQLKTLTRGLFNRIRPKLIRLNDNPWHCSCEMSDWKPMIVNKIKQKSTKICETQTDKGVSCDLLETFSITYAYDNKVSPRCNTPLKFKNWNIFHIMRRQLKCADFKPKLKKKPSKTKGKINSIVKLPALNEHFAKSNENLAKSNENLAVSNENLQTSYENPQISHENRRIFNEISNENLQISNENLQISNENSQISNENSQISNEYSQISNENSHTANEYSQISNENLQMSLENSQTSHEYLQASNENSQINENLKTPNQKKISKNAFNNKLLSSNRRQTERPIKQNFNENIHNENIHIENIHNGIIHNENMPGSNENVQSSHENVLEARNKLSQNNNKNYPNKYEYKLNMLKKKLAKQALMVTEDKPTKISLFSNNAPDLNQEINDITLDSMKKLPGNFPVSFLDGKQRFSPYMKMEVKKTKKFRKRPNQNFKTVV